MENDRGGKDAVRSYRARYPLSPVCVERVSGNAVRVSAKRNRQYGTGDGNACRKQTSDRAHGQLCRNNAEVKQLRGPKAIRGGDFRRTVRDRYPGRACHFGKRV